MPNKPKFFLISTTLALSLFCSFLDQKATFAEDSQLKSFSPVLVPAANGAMQYISKSIGGYSFVYESKWKNTGNYVLQGRLNIITFSLVKDAKQYLNLTVSETAPEDAGKPIGLRKRFGASLDRKGVKYSSLTDRTVKIGKHSAEIAEANIVDKKTVTMLAMEFDGLSLVGTMGFFPDAKAASEQDLINVLSSFKKTPKT